ncbi:nuclear protein 96-domain-containing protein [Neohortaea acidophila]|uniref:Nuclear protein 96-domain-containing protein n=1 Tax=Neohortaea acidophila TaxID=245834 RepID=A0A6A6PI26_9PEZI|nr:nuclear protein 96-domain-containing protein [Neohortaea acidophila]KAF2479183.1 nuclear protein 96-domain-containing protein [Neohortaea acidophila]
MSFGFGNNNNNNNTNNTFGGFGSSNTGGGFAANPASTGGSLFGGNTATSGGFSGFGAANNTNTAGFGAPKPAFGASTTTTGGSLFGGNTATSGGFGGGGGFGNTANTGGFGGNTSGGLFGSQQNQPKPSGFGSTNTGGSLFGGANNTTGGFGGTNTATSNPFGGSTSGGFGGSTNTNTNTGTGGFGFGAASTGAAANNNGTANTPFNAFSEKDPVNSSTSFYQSITFQQPYANKSFEELRTEDYAQGRRFGNTNGQAGGFGQSTGFGGFGATNTTSAGGSMFGGNTATTGTSAFGSNNTATNTNTFGGFGGNTNNSGSLFGNKPAQTGGLFGGQQTAGTTTGGFGSTANTGGSVFGGANSAFGGTNNNNTSTTGGGLFGSNNNQQPPKPAFGGFGATNTTTNTGAFGNTANTGGSLFGGNNTNTGGSLFGGNNQQQQSNPFGANNTANTGGSLFGNNAPKPAGGSLFGSTNNTANTGGSLFGAQNNQQQSNPFGQSTNTGGSLFGNQNQNKPAGTSLFGNSTNTGGSLFGGNQNNQSTGGGLFGGNNNAGSSLFGNANKPPGGSLFGNTGNTSNTNSGLSLFGNNQQNQQNNAGGSLFGGLNNNANQQGSNSGSLFGGSLNQSQGPARNQLHASLTGSPYGNEQLFSSLAAPSPPIGPLATPLNGARPSPRKTPSLLASARVNTPVYSPRGGSFGRTGGYGFNYSTYGTPGSAFTSGSLTPGASSLLRPTGSLSSALTSRLTKSLSGGNLRSDSVASEGRSLLRPSAFSPEGTPGSYANGNVRKLKIDRSLRTDLFGPEPKAIETVKENEPPALSKTVSFEKSADQESSTPKANASNALARTEDREDDQSPGLIRSGPSKSNVSKTPEMEQVNGALTTVPEDAEAPRSAPASRPVAHTSKPHEVGDYWTKPALKDLKNMSRQQLKNVGNFVVGREGVGRIEFGSVDLTNTPLEDICGNVVQLNPRSATVYQDDQDKPAMGKALNVPSTIYLENSWPRSHGGRKPVTTKSGKEYEKHIARLKRVGGTHFLNYDPATGVWSFKVDHFTTYGLDDDDEESDFPDDSKMVDPSSPLSDAPETPTAPQDLTMQSVDTGTGEVDDTFEFMLDRRSQLIVPGGFDESAMYDFADVEANERLEEPEQHVMCGGLGDAEMNNLFVSPGGAVQAPSPGAVERYHSSLMEPDDDQEAEEQGIPGSFVEDPKPTRSILKAGTALSMLASPQKLATESWEEQLQRTLSPRKRDRQALKEMQHSFLRARADDLMSSPFKQSMLGQSVLGQSYLAQKSAKKANTAATHAVAPQELGKSQAFRTAMDLMDSMYSPEKPGRKAGAECTSFTTHVQDMWVSNFPHSKKPRHSTSDADDAAWHETMKPHFSNDGTLVYSVPASWPQHFGELSTTMRPVVSEHHDVRFGRFTPASDINAIPLLAQKIVTNVEISTGFPIAYPPEDILFSSLSENVDDSPAFPERERALWQLCSILYDPTRHGCRQLLEGVSSEQLAQLAPHEERIRLDTVTAFWAHLVTPSVQEGLKRARSAEEKALLLLTQNDVPAACDVLIEAKDFKLAMFVAQLPTTEQSQAMMKKQIDAWRDRNDWSEMSDAVRALYSILAGELCTVVGKSGAAEDRAAEFNLAERFGLSWQQSLALRLNLGGYATVQDAVEAYHAQLESGREKTVPFSTTTNGSKTDDVLMELLRLYAGFPNTAKLLDPNVTSGSPMDARVSWQLASLLSASKHCKISSNELDQLAYEYATQLESAGKFVTGAWITLHIRDPQARQRALGALLNRHGDKISTPGDHTVEDSKTFEYLTQDNKVPSAPVWRAKALYAKAGLHNPGLQAEWLLRAGDLDAAHEVLCTTVGPQAVIEQDYALLANLLQQFGQRRVGGWERGGEVYADYHQLVRARQSGGASGGRLSAGVQAAMVRFRRGLDALKEGDASGKSRGLLETVAVIEMRKVLEEMERGEGVVENEGLGMGVKGEVGGEMLRRYQRAMGSVV